MSRWRRSRRTPRPDEPRPVALTNLAGRRYATNLTGRALPAGHFLPEETLSALEEFLARSR
jgi:hypothetical protein